MPYRRAHVSCGACLANDAVDICPRCRAPVCVQHIPFGGQRCDACEDIFRSRLAAVHLGRWHLLGYALVAPLYLVLADPIGVMWGGKIWAYGALTSGLAIVDAVVILIGGGAALGWLLVTARRAGERWRFLKR